jgi:hypothetical protein
MSAVRDRAAVVTTSIVQIVTERLRDDPELREQIAAYLRDEFFDAAQQARNDIPDPD